MRVKEPSSALPEKVKRSRRPTIPHDEDSSDDAAESAYHFLLFCYHVREYVLQLCFYFKGCGENSESQHSWKHYKSSKTEPHCIVISLSTWIIWCYECNEKLSTHCNKKALAQIADFLQKHVSKIQASPFSRIIKLCEEKCETGDMRKGRKSSSVTAVKGITNLGNTCFFNAVMQNLAQTYILTELMNEIKENGTKLKIFPSLDCQLDPLMVELSSPGPLTSALFLFLHTMKETERGPLSPKVLFSQLCQKAPRFKGCQQQDSQELLHYLLDAVRIEETKRIQASILKAFNNPTTKTADDETRKKVKAYGKEGVKMNFIDRIFIGELTSTVMCEECANISMTSDSFIDISLPIIEERVSKHVLLGRMSKSRSSQEPDRGQNSGTITAGNTHQSKAIKKHFSSKDKDQPTRDRKHRRKLASGEEKTAVLCPRKENRESNGDSPKSLASRRKPASAALSESPPEDDDGSEKEASHSESSVDADSEASGSDCAAQQAAAHPSRHVSCARTGGLPHRPSASDLPCPKEMDSGDEEVAEAISDLHLSSSVIGERDLDRENQPVNVPNHLCFSEQKLRVSDNPQNAFQTLSQSYVTTPKECSVQSCLYQFTSMELLMGNNKLLCLNCTKKQQQHQKETSSAETKAEGVYTNARKQLLISAVPAVLILHLKRFHQVRALVFVVSVCSAESLVRGIVMLLTLKFSNTAKTEVSEMQLPNSYAVELYTICQRLFFGFDNIHPKNRADESFSFCNFVRDFCVFHLLSTGCVYGLVLLSFNHISLSNTNWSFSVWKNVSVGDQVLYGLYGVVEHSGSMRGGHYTAYVRVRTPSKSFMEHVTGKKNVAGLKECESEPTEEWVHVSDTCVQVVPESRALNAQAYLLFYERVL
ncbi:ubiquitin carboxyl-terminal hydrolase 45 [Echinops telfairi]|uniref:Ubiquitin carboxyl-terminal hydrolase n=1 Tax=Echinops telfairi TaxID=9371 RepID=A0ABM1VL12_ECHTE|nr:ubiquitin carboxyl-terminal hydrolase 45 [Echinops telfairi]